MTAKGGGIEVENQAGDRWKLAGDKTLSFSPDTMKIAQKALAQSEANLRVATSTQGPLNYAQPFSEVWKVVPTPSATGAKEIQAMIDTFADAANPKAVDEFATLTIRELPIALEVLEARGFVRKRAAHGTGAPTGTGTTGRPSSLSRCPCRRRAPSGLPRAEQRSYPCFPWTPASTLDPSPPDRLRPASASS